MDTDRTSSLLEYEKLLDNLTDAILLISSEFHVIYFNAACMNLLDLSLDNTGENNIFRYIHPDYLGYYQKSILSIIEDKEKISLTDQKLLQNDGSEIDVEVMATPFVHGNQTYAQVTLRDSSRRMNAERMLTHKDRLASLGLLSAGIAHEIRNPLTTVRGFLQLYKEDDKQFYLDTMETELDKAINTVNELLQISKPDVQEEKMPVYLADELEALLILFQNKFYSIEVETDIRNRECKVMGKRNLLQKAVFNLLKNAIEAISENKGRIRVEHFVIDRSVHVTISDSGSGISSDKLSLVGTPFFSTKSDGTGLGLTQVFTTIHEHNGTIEFYSEENKGTEFIIKLPLLT